MLHPALMKVRSCVDLTIGISLMQLWPRTNHSFHNFCSYRCGVHLKLNIQVCSRISHFGYQMSKVVFELISCGYSSSSEGLIVKPANHISVFSQLLSFLCALCISWSVNDTSRG